MMLNEARWPNVDAGGLWRPKLAVAEDGRAGSETWTLTDEDIPEDIADDILGAVVTHTNNQMFWGFTGMGQVIDYDPSSKTFSFEQATPNNNPAYDLPGRLSNYYLRGKKSLLDDRSEWFNDATEHRLHLGVNPAGRRIEAKARTWAFDLGDRSHIRIEGIRLFASTIHAGGSGIVLDRLRGLYIHHDLNVKAFWDPAKYGGISLGGRDNEIRNSRINWSSGNGILLAGIDLRAVNNKITNIGYLGTDAPAIADLGARSLISYNTAYQTGKNVVDLYGSYSILEHNDLCCNGAFSHDVGVVYVFGRGNIIRHNWIHDAHSHTYASENDSNMALYLDGGSRDNLVYRNVVSNATGAAVALWVGGLNFNEIYNNTFYNADSSHLIGGVGFEPFIGPLPFSRDLWGTRVINNAFERIASVADSPSGEEQGIVMRTNVFPSTEPILADPDHGDFSPLGPLVDAGEVIPGVTDGLEGAAPDIGAFETTSAGWRVGQQSLKNPPRPTYDPVVTPWANRVINAGFDSVLFAPWEVTAGDRNQVGLNTEVGEFPECATDGEACGFRTGVFALETLPGPAITVAQKVSQLPVGEGLCLTGWLRGTPG
ncbi:MAG: right-handed parallel beta-helix repeat-containing protein [Actinomycetota bacterium]|nr:right-handed parallel beta-helix repeat-containing protein [Actinomycetota bacterium]